MVFQFNEFLTKRTFFSTSMFCSRYNLLLSFFYYECIFSYMFYHIFMLSSSTYDIGIDSCIFFLNLDIHKNCCVTFIYFRTVIHLFPFICLNTFLSSSVTFCLGGFPFLRIAAVSYLICSASCSSRFLMTMFVAIYLLFRNFLRSDSKNFKHSNDGVIKLCISYILF